MCTDHPGYDFKIKIIPSGARRYMYTWMISKDNFSNLFVRVNGKRKMNENDNRQVRTLFFPITNSSNLQLLSLYPGRT